MAITAIDTNVLVGLLDDRDKWHDVVVALCDELSKSQAELVYFDCIINETVSVLARRTSEQKRPEQLDFLLYQLESIIPVNEITWASEATSRLYPEILKLVRASSGKLNFHDALIALTCREQGISVLISFDQDFDELDWLTRIERAEQVVEMLYD